MMGCFKRLFSEEIACDLEPDHWWNAMASLDPRNSLARLQRLNLNSKQFPVVRGLLDGTLPPAECPGVTDWCLSEAVSPTGMDALTHALQIALESAGTTLVFPSGQQTPAAMLPKFVRRSELTLVVSHVGGAPVIITSLDEFLSSNSIVDYSFDTLTPSELRRRCTGMPDFLRNRLDRDVTPSVTIEKRAERDATLSSRQRGTTVRPS